MDRAPQDPLADPAPISGAVHALGARYRDLAASTAALAAAELQLAAATGALLLGLAIVLALLTASAWILAMLALATYLAGAPEWSLALGGVALGNLAGAYGCWLWIRWSTPQLTLRTLRKVLFGQAEDVEGPSEAH